MNPIRPLFLAMLLPVLFSGCATTQSDEPRRTEDTAPRFYEMRTYHPAEGKMEGLHQRFKNHTRRLFKKHGISELGYWVPLDEKDQRLIFILSYPTREAREKALSAFTADPEWQAAAKASEVNGKLVTKVEQVFLQPTDYSPKIQSRSAPPRVFELRTYTAGPGKLSHLNSRFRDHTVKLFARHGMTNIGYWTPLPGEKGSDDTLIYLLSHASREAADASFKKFRDDPEWTAARKASEEKAGGSLTVRDGVKSLFLKATDYSPTR